jgi:hypothetical protein
MGSQIMWMFVALHEPCSKYCNDGRLAEIFRHDKSKIKKFIVVFDWNQQLQGVS